MLAKQTFWSSVTLLVIDSQYLVVVEKEFQNESCEDVDPPSSSWCFHLSCHCWWRFICCFFVLVNLFFPLCHCLVLHFPTGFLWSELPGEFLLIFTFFSRSTSLLGSWSAGLSPFFRQSLKFVRWRGFVLCWGAVVLSLALPEANLCIVSDIVAINNFQTTQTASSSFSI